MKRICRILAAGILLIATQASAAQDKDGVAVRATVDRRTIFIGDRILLSIQVVSGEKLDIEFQKFPDSRIGGFEIRDSGVKYKKGFFGAHTAVNWHSITIYSAGKQTIPAIEVKYRNRIAKDWSAKKTIPINITVETVLPKNKAATDIKDVKGPIRPFEINWLYVFIASAASLVGVLLFIKYKRRKLKAALKLPHETALEEIEAVKAAYQRTSDVKEYHIGMSDCVRRYIERAFKVKAPEMTTEEFLISLNDSEALSEGHKKLLREFLGACDLVKFAKYMPTRTEIESVYLTAGKLVQETKDVRV